MPAKTQSPSSIGSFPKVRLRRLRRTAALRSLVQETQLHPSNFMLPVFACDKPDAKASGVARQYSVTDLAKRLESFAKAGGKSILLFGVPQDKDEKASEAYADKGVTQRALRQIKKSFGEDLVIATDLCFCSYTDHGHCGILRKGAGANVDNDATLEIIGKTAASQAEAGADIIAPSGMMDGQIQAIRTALDDEDLKETAILSYSAKYSSVLYGPFRDIAHSAPGFGNRKSYQMNPPNAKEAMREMALDVEEGADMLMVKPAQFYLDIIAKAKERFELPLAAYQVSGEAWMVEEYVKAGMAKREDAILESVTAIKRAGADIVISYFSEEILGFLK